MRSRRSRLAAGGLLLLALPLSGCLSIRSEGVSQRAPGAVTLGGVVCGSDYNRSSYQDCDGDGNDGTGPANVAEPDNRAHQGCDADGAPADGTSCTGLNGTGQLLVGFRVPVGSEGPDGFFSDAQDLHFDRNPVYEKGLQARFPAPADQHWVGYVSTVRTFASGPSADSPTGIHPEFTLPAGAAPFAGPYRWRWVAGFRRIDKDQASLAVDCTAFGTFCVDSPPEERVTTDLPAENVSDFAVSAPPAAVSVPQAGTATVQFALRYADARALGERDFSVSAATSLPGAAPAVSTDVVHAVPNGTTPVTVTVPLPPGTPTGSFTVTLSASTGAPAVTRTSTATVVVGPPPDGDGDGLADPADRCPGTPRGAFDADRDGCVGPYGRIASIPAGVWSVSRRGLRIGSMHMSGLPAGTRVRLTCRACHVARTLSARSARLELAPLRDRLLRRRQGFTVTATAPGFIGERVTLTVKRFGRTRKALVQEARRPFTRRQLCLPVASAKPARTCSATPPTGP